MWLKLSRGGLGDGRCGPSGWIQRTQERLEFTVAFVPSVIAGRDPGVTLQNLCWVVGSTRADC
jgi:hypothetical protein